MEPELLNSPIEAYFYVFSSGIFIPSSLLTCPWLYSCTLHFLWHQISPHMFPTGRALPGKYARRVLSLSNPRPVCVLTDC